MERQPNTEYVLSISYGKDSIACLEAIYQLGLPLDRIVHAEVWATDTIPADLPPMVEFKKFADQVIKFRYGIDVEHIHAVDKNGEKLTYEKMFYHKPVRKAKPGGDSRIPSNQRNMVQQPTQTICHTKDFHSQGEVGARSSKQLMRYGSIYGFPISSPRGGNWCTAIKTRVFSSAPFTGGNYKYCELSRHRCR